MTDSEQHKSAPEALMLLGTQCPHCPYVLASLSDLVKKGVLSRLEVVNLEQRPDIAQELGVQSVPWVRIGQFELTGLRSKSELEEWIEKANTSAGNTKYIEELLAEGKVNQVLGMIEKDNQLLQALLELIADGDAKINARLGVGVIMEEYEGKSELATLIPGLGELTRSQDARVRSDAAHYLSLTHDVSVKTFIEPLLEDSHAEVREVAEESLAELNAG
jgi:thioredoxin-like negative regulator of GroEL